MRHSDATANPGGGVPGSAASTPDSRRRRSSAEPLLAAGPSARPCISGPRSPASLRSSRLSIEDVSFDPQQPPAMPTAAAASAHSASQRTATGNTSPLGQDVLGALRIEQPSLTRSAGRSGGAGEVSPTGGFGSPWHGPARVDRRGSKRIDRRTLPRRAAAPAAIAALVEASSGKPPSQNAHSNTAGRDRQEQSNVEDQQAGHETEPEYSKTATAPIRGYRRSGGS